MGIYDEYGERGIQLKVSNDGELGLRTFSIGDKVPLDNGAYIGHEGVVVVVGGVLVAEFDHVIDKWGNPVSYAEWLMRNNSITEAIEETKKSTLSPNL